MDPAGPTFSVTPSIMMALRLGDDRERLAKGQRELLPRQAIEPRPGDLVPRPANRGGGVDLTSTGGGILTGSRPCRSR